MTAKTRNSVPLNYPMNLSDIFLVIAAPPMTAIAVETACAHTAPNPTQKGSCAAERAIVLRNDLSPNSAANTSPKILSMCALCV